MKSYMNWSGGKDSALALYHLQKDQSDKIECLVTNINGYYDRISMHGVRSDLLEQQASSIGIPLKKVFLPQEPSMKEYEKLLGETTEELYNEGYRKAIFGDIFLEDLKKYREENLKPFLIECNFPLWKRNTRDLLNEFLDLGFKTIVVCINSKYLPESFCGRIIDKKFIEDLPENVDPCGENGEFHTFVFDGPIFKTPVNFTKGEITYRTYTAPKLKEDNCFTTPHEADYGFYFCDLNSL